MECRQDLRGSDDSVMSTQDTCGLCQEFRDGRSLHHAIAPRLPRSRAVMTGADWALIPTIGPICEGHMMYVPHAHSMSVLATTKPTIVESQAAIERAAWRLAQLYRSPVVCFEHGSTASNDTYSGACIAHVHMHITPGPLSFVESVVEEFEPWRQASSLVELRSDRELGSYLLVAAFRDSKMTFWMHNCDEDIPSQLLRQHFCQSLGNTHDWDWRVFPKEDVMLATIRRWHENE